MSGPPPVSDATMTFPTSCLTFSAASSTGTPWPINAPDNLLANSIT
jgi:hypothetical protein